MAKLQASRTGFKTMAAKPPVQKKYKKSKSTSDDNGISKPLNPFFSFKQEHTEYISKCFPGLHCFDRNRIAGKLWANLTEETKQKYYDRYRNALQTYKKETAKKYRLEIQGKANAGTIPNELSLYPIHELNEEQVGNFQPTYNSIQGLHNLKDTNMNKPLVGEPTEPRIEMSLEDRKRFEDQMESIRREQETPKPVKFVPNISVQPDIQNQNSRQESMKVQLFQPNDPYYTSSFSQIPRLGRLAKMQLSPLRLNTTAIPISRGESANSSSSLTPTFHDRMSFGFTPTKSAFFRDYCLPFDGANF